MASSSKAGNQSSSADIISMHLHNEPGRLRLIGSGDNGGGQWRAAYQAWSVALWTRDPVLLGVADEQLVAATEQWLSLRPLGSPAALKIVRAGWNGYLRRATGSRGMRHLGARDRFPDAGPSDEADAIARSEPEVELIDTIAANHFADGTPRRVRMARGTRGITIYADRESIELRTSDRSQMSEALARSLCAKLVEVALTIFQGAEGHEVVLEALRPVSVTIGNEPHELGWRFFGSSNPFACFVLRTLDGRIRRSGTYWTMALSLGDPRTSMGAHADGRAFLRFPRSLSSEHTTVWFST
jgi:hypothetical protein